MVKKHKDHIIMSAGWLGPMLCPKWPKGMYPLWGIDDVLATFISSLLLWMCAHMCVWSVCLEDTGREMLPGDWWLRVIYGAASPHYIISCPSVMQIINRHPFMINYYPDLHFNDNRHSIQADITCSLLRSAASWMCRWRLCSEPHWEFWQKNETEKERGTFRWEMVFLSGEVS